ncbi:MAG: CbiX/SirB N-terminal domain-containing protein [Thermoanaerobacteraceae bacterium]|nr:CbiX/SirB N-terminal domain-containing protein [Thermoanaerobacteraceae bacterium]
MEGIIVLGHGSRAAVDGANDFLELVAAEVRKIFSTAQVEPAWMNPKSQRQNLFKAVDRLVAEGARRIIVAPVFLTDGLHIRKDIPENLAALREQYPGVEFRFARNLGFDMRIVAILAERIGEVRGEVSQ